MVEIICIVSLKDKYVESHLPQHENIYIGGLVQRMSMWSPTTTYSYFIPVFLLNIGLVLAVVTMIGHYVPHLFTVSVNLII